MTVAWGAFWGGSWSTKPGVFLCKVAAVSDEGYVLCAAGVAAVVPGVNRFLLCSATGACSCVRRSVRFLNHWLHIVVLWLHDCCYVLLPCA